MSHQPYRTAPLEITTMPPGIGYIVGNEAAERFSYYGMKAILVTFMTQHLMNSNHQLDVMSDTDAKAVYHWFSASNYAFGILGAPLADIFLGKYRTIVYLSIVYCLGHLALAMDVTRLGLFLGLGLIALGSGGIKPCVSAHVGDQFTHSNKHLIAVVYGWFYFSINFGSVFSQILTPELLQIPGIGPHLAFGVPGILMAVATLVFWLGRNRYTHIPPRRTGFFREATSPEGRGIIVKLSVIFLFMAVFWSLYDQTGAAWVLQAKNPLMDRHMLGKEWDPAQIQTINPILIMLFIPLFKMVIFPVCERIMYVTPLGKMSVGFFFVTASFGLSGLIEVWLEAGSAVSVWWQMLGFLLMTIGEFLIYFTCLEFSYTQAPPTMKSFIMALNLFSVTVGNVFTALVNTAMSNSTTIDAFLKGSKYYWFFTLIMLVGSFLFIYVALTYKGRTYLQDSAGLVDEGTDDSKQS